MKDLEGAYIENRLIKIEHYVPHPHKNPQETFTNVYIKNLPETIRTSEDLGKLFEEFGEVQSPFLPMDESTKDEANPEGTPRPFGFCNMADHDSAVRAVEGLNNKQLGDQELYCGRAKSKAERKRELEIQAEKIKKQKYNETKDRNFYVRNFDERISEEEIKAKFEEYGEIESFKIVPVDGGTRRYCFVCYGKKEDADVAMADSNRISFNGQPIYMAYFKPVERRQKEQQLSQHGRQMTTATTSNTFMTPSQTQGSSAGFMAPPQNQGSSAGFMAPPQNQGSSAGFMDPNHFSVKQGQSVAAQMLNPMMMVERPRDKLRIAILEECTDQDIIDSQPYINALKKMSDDQAAVLNSNQSAFRDWFDNITDPSNSVNRTPKPDPDPKPAQEKEENPGSSAGFMGN